MEGVRTALPQLRSNGHAAPPGRVFAISGMCQDPRFRVRFRGADPADFCFIYLGATQFGIRPAASLPESDGDPYFVLRRHFDGGQAAVAVRVDWEGIFTVLANDDELAEIVFREMIEPGAPEEVQRQWSEEPATVAMFTELLCLS